MLMRFVFSEPQSCSYLFTSPVAEIPNARISSLWLVLQNVEVWESSFQQHFWNGKPLDSMWGMRESSLFLWHFFIRKSGILSKSNLFQERARNIAVKMALQQKSGTATLFLYTFQQTWLATFFRDLFFRAIVSVLQHWWLATPFLHALCQWCSICGIDLCGLISVYWCVKLLLM